MGAILKIVDEASERRGMRRPSRLRDGREPQRAQRVVVILVRVPQHDRPANANLGPTRVRDVVLERARLEVRAGAQDVNRTADAGRLLSDLPVGRDSHVVEEAHVYELGLLGKDNAVVVHEGSVRDDRHGAARRSLVVPARRAIIGLHARSEC